MIVGALKLVGLPETSLKLIDLSLTINVYWNWIHIRVLIFHTIGYYFDRKKNVGLLVIIYLYAFSKNQGCECYSIYMYFCKFVMLLYLNLAGMTNKDILTVSKLGRCTRSPAVISIQVTFHFEYEHTYRSYLAADADREWN